MKKKFYLLSLIFVSQLAFIHLSAQNDVDYTDLENYLENARQSFEVPGIAIGIFKDGEIVFGYCKQCAWSLQW